jgi:acyl-CoA synthetase (AMP-forming)/AMP-acid ligase II
MLYAAGRQLTFADFWQQTIEVAGACADRQMSRSAPVSWQLPGGIEAALLCSALRFLGVPQNPMLPMYGIREISSITDELGTSHLLTPRSWNGTDFEARAKAALESRNTCHLIVEPANFDLEWKSPHSPNFREADQSEGKWFFYTSGTTSRPKGATHVDASILAAAQGYVEKLVIDESDTSLVAFPFTHIGGLIVGIVVPLLTGSSAVLIDAWSPQKAASVIEDFEITLANSTPAMVAQLLPIMRDSPEKFATVRAIPCGGSNRPPMLHHEVRKALPLCRDGLAASYGLTEMPLLAQTAISAPDSSKSQAEGTPNRGVEVRLIDASLEDVAAGMAGELAVRGSSLMQGYVDPEMQREAFTPDGYFRTGDLARIDQWGAIVITGRLKDVIIRKAENISALEVEELLLDHPGIVDVSVIGLPDAERGEMVCAVVVPRDPSKPPTLEDLFEFCENSGMMIQKIPERVIDVVAIPRTATGKVNKSDLREWMLGLSDAMTKGPLL